MWGVRSFLSKSLRKEEFLRLVRGFNGIEIGESFSAGSKAALEIIICFRLAYARHC